MYGNTGNANNVLAMMAANGLVSSIISTATVICMIVGMWKMFSKADKPGWAALIPFYQTWVWGSVVFANKKKTIVWLASEIIMVVLLGIVFVLALTSAPATTSSMYPSRTMAYSSTPPIQASGAVLVAGLLFMVSLAVYSVLTLMAIIATAWSFGKRDGFAVGLIFLAPIFLLIVGFSQDAKYVGPEGTHDSEYVDYDNQPVEDGLPYPVQPEAGFKAGQLGSSEFAGEPPVVPLPVPVPMGMNSASQPIGAPEMLGALGAAPQPVAPGMMEYAPQPGAVSQGFEPAPQPQVQAFSQVGDSQGLQVGAVQQSSGQIPLQVPQPDVSPVGMFNQGPQGEPATASRQDVQPQPQTQPLYPANSQVVQQNGLERPVGSAPYMPNAQEVQHALQAQIGQETHGAFSAQPGWEPAQELQVPMMRSGWEPGQPQQAMQQQGLQQQVQQQVQTVSQVQPDAANGFAQQPQVSPVFSSPQIQQTAQIPPVQQVLQAQPPLQEQQFPQAQLNPQAQQLPQGQPPLYDQQFPQAPYMPQAQQMPQMTPMPMMPNGQPTQQFPQVSPGQFD